MKKTLVALSVLAAAGSAQAIEIYNQDKVTVNMTGDVEVRYVKGKADGSEFKQEIDDADFGFDTRYMVNDDLQVGAYWEFDGSDKTNTTTGDVYMALYSNTFGSIKFGRLATQLDDAGIGNDYVFGVNGFVSDNFDISFDEAVRYDIDKGTFYGGLGFVQNKGGHLSTDEITYGKDSTIFDAKLGARFADFDARVFYGQLKVEDGVTTSAAPGGQGKAVSGDSKFAAFEIGYAGVENLNLDLGYYQIDESGSVAGSPDLDDGSKTIAFAADYTLNAWNFAGGVSRTSYDNERQAEVGSTYDSQVDWFVNAGYALAPSTTAYLEVGGDDGYTDNKKNGVGVGVGLKAEF